VPNCLHIGYPCEQTIPGIQGHISALAGNPAGAALTGWIIKPQVYDVRNSLNAADFTGQVLSIPGPALMLRPVQAKTLADVTQRLEGRQLVIAAEAYDWPTLLAAVTEVKQHHDLGEPLVPLLRAVALMVVRKLDREQMWAGNSKGYMWTDSIPKGRGVDEAYHQHVADVVFLLTQHGILIYKISNSQKKYALNPERRAEVKDFLRNRKFPNALEQIFARRGTTVSARALDLLDDCDP
jgi:hypothetical protein